MKGVNLMKTDGTKKMFLSKSTSYYVHSMIVIMFMFCFKYVPPFNPGISEVGMQSLGIFIGVLWGWTFVSMIWSGLLGMVAIGFTGIVTVKESLLSGFGADLTMVTLFVFIFAAHMDESGLNSYIAKWFLSGVIQDMGPFLAIAFIAFSMAILTQFAHNAVLLTIFIPMLCPLVVDFGINPVVLAMTLLYVGNSAFSTPGASTNVALVFANTEWTSRRDVYQYGMISCVMITIVSIFVVLPICSMIFN